MSLLDALRAFLIAQGFENVFKLQYPHESDEMISLHERENPMGFGARGINYGIRAAKVQIRVRRKTPEAAEADARRIFHSLDSGTDEASIPLAPGRSVTSRPAPPFFLESDEKGRWVWVLKATILTNGL